MLQSTRTVFNLQNANIDPYASMDYRPVDQYPMPKFGWSGNETIHGGDCPKDSEATLMYLMAAVSIASVLIYFLSSQIQKRLPLWLLPFAPEEPPAKVTRHGWTYWTVLLLLTSALGSALSIISIILAPQQYVNILNLVPWFSAIVITIAQRPTKTPKILLAQYFLMLLCELAIYSVHFLNRTLKVIDPIDLARVVLSFTAITFIILMPLRDPSWDDSDIGNASKPPSFHSRSPEDNLSLFRFWTMMWVNPLAKISLSRDITEEDVWQLPFDFQHTRLYMAFRELQGRLLTCLIEANGLDLFISTTLAITEKVLEVTNIRLTSKLYQGLDKGNPTEALYWSAVMLFVDMIRQLSKTTSSWYCRKSYERSRGETFIGLFSKLLTRAVPGSDVTEKGPQESHHEEGETPATNPFTRAWRRVFHRKPKVETAVQSQPASNAKVVNLVRGDTYEISQRFWDFSRVVSQPVKIIFTMYYLVDIMGWPSSVGFGLMILFFTINSFLVKKLIKLERQRTSHSDKRAQAVAHFVEASRPLKLNGWTKSWSDRIMTFRAMEMFKRLQIAYVTASISTLNVMGGTTYPLASICLFTIILKNGLPNDVIWPSLQLFSQLEASVKEAFDLISAFWKTTIPIERVHKYMDEPDRDVSSTLSGAAKDITFHDASFSWPSTDSIIISDINLTLGTGLTIIRGKVGAGKSSLLLSALNEMELRQGTLTVPDEPIAYAQQLPWLQNKTIRENIIFNHPFDPERYRQVITACALAPDLAVFADGDQYRLEEGGVGLSGGQKARVALARAVYSPCRILLLDDPLAPLDHDTATAIVRRLLQGELAKDRIIVMVTHRDDLVLRIAQQVVDIKDGQAKILTREEIDEELLHPYHADSADHSQDEGEHSHTVSEEDISGMKEAPEEPSETGGVSWTVYISYMAAGGWHLWILLGIAYGVSRFCDVARARLLEAWGSNTAGVGGGGYWGLPDSDLYPRSWILALAGLSAGQIISYGIAQVLLARISVNAAQQLFKIAVDKVSQATFRYQDITPTGQLKNRLISDMGMVDGGILAPLEGFVFNLISLIMSIVAIATHQPILLVIIFVVACMFMFFFRTYVPASRCLRRMEMRYLTPIIANIGVMQDGLVTIRAMRGSHHFQDRHLQAVDDFQKQDHFFWSMAFWLDFRLSMSSAIMRAALVVLMVYLQTAAAAVGFVLTQTTIAMAAVQQLCERFAQLQLDAVSLERVNMLNRIPAEPQGGEEPPEDWPRPCDDVTFEEMSFRYDDDLPSVLDKITLTIPGGSTCAVLGRTGSGKSTIANALLATQLPHNGTVKIGSMDLSKIDRTALRNRVTFIQQDPILFPGTLRDNLDPEGKFSDEACENAIHRVLGPEWGLNSAIDAGGKNLSQGQRQLVGIGRAVLRRSGLVILDEATASIDRGTAAMVQRILREELAQSTVITIAHRLEAVEDANWMLRLERGKVLENGPASNLNSK